MGRRSGTRILLAGVSAGAGGALLTPASAAVLLGTGLFALAVAVPYWGILLAVAADGLAGYLTWHDLSLFGLLLAGAGVGLLVRLALAGWRVERPVVIGLALPLTALVGLMAASAVGALDPRLSLRYTLNYAAGGAFALLVALLAGERRRLAVILGLLFVLTAAGGLLGALQVAVSSRFLAAQYLLPELRSLAEGYSRLPRAFGFSAASLNFGKDMLTGALIALALLLAGGRGRRLAAAAVGAGLMGVILSGTRSSWAGAAAGALLVAALAGSVHRRRAVVGVSALTVAAAGGGWALGAAGIWETALLRPESDALRVALLRAGLALVGEHPWLGVGMGNFQLHLATRFPPDLLAAAIDPRAVLPAHNVFMEILTGAGPFTLAAYLLILAGAAGALARAWRSPDRWTRALAAGVAGALVGYMIDASFHSHDFDNRLWLLIGLAYAAARSGRSTAPDRDRDRSPALVEETLRG